MVMTSFGMGDVLRDRLPALWRRIEDAHYSYLETEDSPEKLQQKKKLEGYIIEYLSLVPHECKFGLAETGKVFQRTMSELAEFSAYRAGLGWAALERYAANLLVQPWRKEYKVIRLYCGYYKHEVEANMVGAETLLYAMGYKPVGAGRVALDAPICPDMVAAISRDAIIAQCECQMMANVWEAVWGGGGRVSWAQIYRERASRAGDVAATVAGLTGNRDKYCDAPEIYSNVPTTSEPSHRSRLIDPRYNIPVPYNHACETPEEPITPIPYLVPNMMPPMYPVNMPIQDCGIQPMMAPYGVPYYYPIQAPYMIPQVYAPVKHLPMNGYSQYRYPLVPTGQLIELEPYEAKDGYKKRLESRKNSTSKSGFSDVSLPSLPRSDTQPALSKAREDGMGTYESWDYVFRNLSSKEQDDRSRFSPSLDRDSRTLDRLDREEKRSKYLPATLDLEDGLQALNIDRSYDDDYYRTTKVNESLIRLKQEQEKRARLLKKQVDEKRSKRPVEPIGNPTSDALVSTKVAPDKIKLLSKKDIKDRKDVIKQQVSSNGSNGSICSAEIRKVKKTIKPSEVERPKKPVENGHHNAGSSRNSAASTKPYDLKAQLVVSLDETDSVRPTQNGHHRPSSRNSQTEAKTTWQCTTCTYLNTSGAQACEMCGKSKRGPEIEPLTSGGRECPACTLVNKREARSCDACGTSLDHCPTYI